MRPITNYDIENIENILKNDNTKIKFMLCIIKDKSKENIKNNEIKIIKELKVSDINLINNKINNLTSYYINKILLPYLKLDNIEYFVPYRTISWEYDENNVEICYYHDNILYEIMYEYYEKENIIMVPIMGRKELEYLYYICNILPQFRKKFY